MLGIFFVNLTLTIDFALLKPYFHGINILKGAPFWLGKGLPYKPVTTVVTGLYGKPLPNQNGAPLRIFIPWKYGFKSAKSIVKIRLTKNMPNTAWKNASPREYGFYSNVNPEVDHPRWSQATERVIGESILAPRIKTLMFNGYGDEVAHLYSGMDLKKNY